VRWLFRWLSRIARAFVLVIAGLLSPLVCIETMCRLDGQPSIYTPLLSAEWH